MRLACLLAPPLLARHALASAALASACLASACRERRAPEPQLEVGGGATSTVAATPDAGPEIDPLVAAVAALEDAAGDVHVPAVDVTIVAVKVTPRGALADPLGTLARERWRFRACARWVEEDDAAPPLVSVTIRVGEGGEPSTTSAPPGRLGDCLAKAARAVVFAEPDGGICTADVTLRWTRVPAR